MIVSGVDGYAAWLHPCAGTRFSETSIKGGRGYQNDIAIEPLVATQVPSNLLVASR